eukprot:9310665-Heterocapsa_arctica.AAC.1
MPIQRAGARLVWRVCRIVVRVQKTDAAAASEALEAAAEARAAWVAANSAPNGPGVAPLVPSTAGLVEMGSVVDQRSKEQRPALSEEKVRGHYLEYRRTFGRDPQPGE